VRAAAPLLLLALAACSPGSPEARVRKAFDAAVAAVEKGDAAGAAAVLSPKFLGPEGMDRAGARLYLLGVLRGRRVGVTVLGNRIEAGEREATQTVDLLFTSRGGGGLLPDDQGRRTLVIRWEARDGAWLVREVQSGP